ncbi:MAG: class I SAM-dependent methyltransferase [Burkholderiaceae bacterium]
MSGDHVTREFGDDYFKGSGTSGYADYLASEAILRRHGERYARLIKPYIDLPPRTETRSRLLDVGCAAGMIMQGFEAAGWSVTGIDPNQSMIEYARGLGLDAHRGTLETVSTVNGLNIPDDGFDLVVLIQVIAHLHNLPEAVIELSRLVRPGGLVLIETWDSNSLTARVLGQYWHEYSPPNVLHYFTRRSLDVLMWQAGFRRRALGRPRKRISVEHACSLVDYKYGNSIIGKTLLSVSRLLPAGFAIPYPSEDLFWALYQREGLEGTHLV